MIVFHAGDYADPREGAAAYDPRAQLTALCAGARTVRFRMYVLTRDNVRIGSVPFREGRVDLDSEASIQRSVVCAIPGEFAQPVAFESHRLQPAMQLRMPDGGWCEWPLGVFLPTSPSRLQTESGAVSYAVEGYDQAVVLRDDRLTSALTIPAGTGYLEAAYGQLQAAGVFRLVSDASDRALTGDIQFEIGARRLDIVNALLTAINFRPVWFDAYGAARFTAYSPAFNRRALHTYAAGGASVVSPVVALDMDTFNIPNVIVALVSREDGVLVSRWINEHPGSALSTVRRGRRVVEKVEVQDIADQETLDEYVKRLGNQTTAAGETVRFETLQMPLHGAWDMMHLDVGDAFGRYEETAWSLDMAPAGRMAHTARKVVLV